VYGLVRPDVKEDAVDTSWREGCLLGVLKHRYGEELIAGVRGADLSRPAGDGHKILDRGRVVCPVTATWCWAGGCHGR
jgi:hypothetical protein